MTDVMTHDHASDACGSGTETFEFQGEDRPPNGGDPHTQLHVHTEHSFLDGIPKIKELVARVVELDQSSIAVTDHGNMSGHLQLQKECDEAGIKPIYGMESYFCPDRRIKEGKKGEKYQHMTLLATNQQGLTNLWALGSRAFIEGSWYGDPRCDWELLTEYNQGIIATGGCIGGCVSTFFNDQGKDYNPDEGVSRISRMLEIFGDRFYLELHTFADELHHALNQVLVQIANEFSIPMIAVSDSHYLRPDDWLDHEIMTAMQMNKKYDDPSRYQYGENQLRLFSGEEVRQRLSYLPSSVVEEAIANTSAIAARTGVVIQQERSMPVFFESPEVDATKLREMIEEGFERKIQRRVPEDQWATYRERIEYEYEIIASKGFPGYMLMLADIVKWGKTYGYLVNVRGSAGGSLMVYLLDISEVDPIPPGLIFERFLDPGRDSLPDIDIDVGQEERPAFREMLESKYGNLNVATIGTLQTLSPKSLMRDLCRCFKVTAEDTTAISKILDQVPDIDTSQIHTNWSDVISHAGDNLQPYIARYPKVFDLMSKFMDHIRHAGAHASGIVVSKEPLMGRLPLRFKPESARSEKGDLRTMMDYRDVEELGFVKFDLLGLRNLTTLAKCRDMARQRNPDADIPDFVDWQYDYDRFYRDPDVYRSLWDGKNIGIFQLESAGLRQLVKRFKPESLEDVCSLISVYRPGITRAIDPSTGLDLLELYMRKREGTLAITYKHPLLEPVLQSTYGNFLYQEQIMKACAVLAGYSLSETDRVRKILGKKLVEKMKVEREEFVRRCGEANQIAPELANAIFDEMETFGLWGFNLSHGWAYSIVVVWCAWMKHYYPREFLTALFATNEDEAPVYARECKRLGIPLLPPDINESGSGFTLTEAGVIRYGLSKIKFVANASKVIEEHQPIATIQDFVDRVPKTKCNKKAAQAVICSGAMDSLVQDEDLAAYPGLHSRSAVALRRYYDARKEKKLDERCECGGTELATKGILVDVDHTNFDHIYAESRVEDRNWCEQELLGTCLSHDPLEPYEQLIADNANFESEGAMLTGEIQRVAGIVVSVRPTVTKKGKHPGSPMCQFWMDLPVREDRPDSDESVQVVCFPEAFARHHKNIQEGVPLMVDVKKLPGGGLSAEKVFRLDLL